MKEHFQVHSPGASQSAIAQLEAGFGHSLPRAYLQLLIESDGVEYGRHDADGDCLRLWPTHELLERNQDPTLREFLPNVVEIGSDGGDEGIFLDRSAGSMPDAWPVVRVSFASLDPEEFVLLAPSFEAWARNEFRLMSPNSQLPSSHD